MKNREEEWSGLEFTVKEEDFEWLKGCCVGLTRSVETVPILQERFYMEGYFSCRLRAMGGKMVLMDCEDKEELKDLMQHTSDWLGQWFLEVTSWSPSMVAKESFNNDLESDESWSEDIDYDDGCDNDSREADKETIVGEEDVARDNLEHEGRGSRLVVAPTPEAKFELDGTGNDETQLNKGDSLSHSRVGDEESVEMVTNSFDMEIEEDDVGDRERVGECEVEFKKGRQTSLGPIASSGRIESGLQLQPNPKTLGQQNRAEGQRGKEAWVSEKGLENLQLGEHSRSKEREGVDGCDAEAGQVEKKEKNQLAEACSTIYKRYVLPGVMNQKKKNKGKFGSRQAEGEEIPKFYPSTSNSIRIGVVVEEEELIIKKLEEMEKWDRATTEVENARGASKAQKGQANIQGWAGFRLKEKLKITKEALKKWSKNFVPLINNRIKEATTQIEQLDLNGESEQLSDKEIERRRQALLALWNNIRYKESMLQQKSRKTWLSNGDANTKFFHSCVKGGWKRNEMNSIQIKGAQYTKASRMKEEIASFFQNMFVEEQWKRPTLEGVNFKRIFAKENNSLTTPFTEEEIKTAVWDCESSKAPRPNGFNFKFIKSEWETIKGDVIGFLQEFQKNGKLVKGLYTSFIVMVPKVDNSQKIEGYRPISLIGAVYKILAKTLANQLKNVLARVVDEQKMAFISGRQLMDGVMIANEIVDEAKKKKKKAFMLKIDFEKAYDKCLRSSMVSVLLNGSPTRQFTVLRGLRQGDPLSPFLFLIIAEGINGLVSKAIQNGLLERVEVGLRGFKVSHLQYADDTLLFGEATEENVWAMKGILRTFELVSGLKINFNKSQLIGIGVEEEWLDKMAWIMCCKKGNLPFKYLGIPIGGSCRKISFWELLVEVFHKKLTTWKGKDYKISQLEGWLNGTWTWHLEWRRGLHSWEEQEVSGLNKMIKDSIITRGKDDIWEWTHSKDGDYSTKLAYQALTREHGMEQQEMALHKVWNTIVPNKISAFSWQVL
ncbi:hypothetical protein SLEP1_g11542 [Rubroshorea leprosula]|nr:hypothetical protein SLEP1_g11542 [Rubroshorea leprosula]